MKKEQDTNTSIRDKAIQWWKVISLQKKQDMLKKYPQYSCTGHEGTEKMYLSENPTTTPKETAPTEAREQGLPDKLTLLVTGSGNRAYESHDKIILRTDDATIHLKRESEFGFLAHALIDRYNSFDELQQRNKELLEAMERICRVNAAPSMELMVDKLKAIAKAAIEANQIK